MARATSNDIIVRWCVDKRVAHRQQIRYAIFVIAQLMRSHCVVVVGHSFFVCYLLVLIVPRIKKVINNLSVRIRFLSVVLFENV